MLNWIEFTDNRFDTNNHNNLLSPITDNMIILCNNYKLMHSLAEEIINTVNGNAEYNDYYCEDEDMGKAEYILNYGMQKVININGQRITLCLEPAMIYKAKDVKDIWFYDWMGMNETYREFIYPMTDFVGHEEVWEEGHDRVYKMIVQGRYGCYDGNWVDIKI